MKLRRSFKIVLYLTLGLLYGSGTCVWIMNQWFQVNRGFGAESSPWAIFILHSHSMVSLWFLIVFGYLWHSHILRGLKANKKLKSGIILVSALAILIITVPGLFYLTDDRQKIMVVQLHTYLGIAVLLPLLVHVSIKVQKKQKG